MTYITGYDRSQLLLLPEAVDDYVGSDNPVRFIDAFVDGLDLAAAGFGRVAPKVTGRPAYAPGDLLKLYIYGYLNRVRSSRRLAAETHRNIEVIWLLRHLKPDFKTIADFRRDNRNAFRQVFREFVLLCRQLDLFGRELLAVDGTRIKAVNKKDRNFTRASLTQFIKAADVKLDDYLQRLDKSDAIESATSGSRVKNLAREDRRDSRAARAAQGHVGGAGPDGGEPDLAHRPRQPGNGGAYACCGGLQRADRRRCQAQADRRATGHEPSCGYGSAGTDRRTGKRGSRSGAHRGRGRPGLFQESRTPRLARMPGSILTCRVPSVVPRSERVCSVKMSSATTQPATASFAPQVSIFIPIHHL